MIHCSDNETEIAIPIGSLFNNPTATAQAFQNCTSGGKAKGLGWAIVNSSITSNFTFYALQEVCLFEWLALKPNTISQVLQDTPAVLNSTIQLAIRINNILDHVFCTERMSDYIIATAEHAQLIKWEVCDSIVGNLPCIGKQMRDRINASSSVLLVGVFLEIFIKLLSQIEQVVVSLSGRRPTQQQSAAMVANGIRIFSTLTQLSPLMPLIENVQRIAMRWSELLNSTNSNRAILNALTCNISASKLNQNGEFLVQSSCRRDRTRSQSKSNNAQHARRVQNETKAAH